MFKYALLGAAVVPLIMGGNYVLRERYKIDMIREAESAIGSVLSGEFKASAFPERQRGAPPPSPFKICGYINDRRYIYDAQTHQFEVDDAPGALCDPRYYPVRH